MTSTPTLAPSPSWGRRLVGMEGLRGLAAVTVLVGHVQSHLATAVVLPGRVDRVLDLLLNGLTLFFALSGFLLFRPFCSAILSRATMPDLRRYATNRVLRIVPAHLVILLLVSWVFGVAYTSSVSRGESAEAAGAHVGRMTDPIDLVTNVFMVHTFLPGSIKTGIGSSWSLSVELVFYAVMPALAFLAYRVTVHRATALRLAAVLAVPAVLLVIGVLGSLLQDRFLAGQSPEDHFYFNWGANWHAVFARSFLVHADLFAFGMVAAVVLTLVEQDRIGGRGLTLTRALSVVTIAVAVLGAERWDLADTWWALGCGALILYVALPGRGSGPGWAAHILEWWPLRSVGLVSYSLYLWHIPVIWMLYRWGWTFDATRAGFVANIVLVLGVSLAFSTATYLAVERPALRLKSRRTTGQDDRRAVGVG